jgi:hypothetical protein
MKTPARSALRTCVAIAATVGLSASFAHANTLSCAKTRITNIHYKCNPAGAGCGGGCVCRNVAGSIWSDCYCLAPGVTGGGSACDSGGKWRVLTAAPLNPGTAVTCQLAHIPGDQLEVFDPVDIGADPDGTIMASTILGAPGDFQGTFVLRALNGPPDQIPIEIVSLNLVSASVPIPAPTGPNTVTLAPGPTVPGVWDSTTGRIQFNSPIPVMIQNSLFPGGLAGQARPSFECAPGFGVTEMDMLPHGVFPLPMAGGGIPTVSEWGLIFMGAGLLAAGMLASRWFGRAL